MIFQNPLQMGLTPSMHVRNDLVQFHSSLVSTLYYMQTQKDISAVPAVNPLYKLITVIFDWFLF